MPLDLVVWWYDIDPHSKRVCQIIQGTLKTTIFCDIIQTFKKIEIGGPANCSLIEPPGSVCGYWWLTLIGEYRLQILLEIDPINLTCYMENVTSILPSAFVRWKGPSSLSEEKDLQPVTGKRPSSLSEEKDIQFCQRIRPFKCVRGKGPSNVPDEKSFDSVREKDLHNCQRKRTFKSSCLSKDNALICISRMDHQMKVH